MQNRLIRFLFFFLIFLLVFQYIGGEKTNQASQDDIEIQLKDKISIGKEVQVQILNHTDQIITFPSQCPQNPLQVERYNNGVWVTKTAEVEIECEPEATLAIEPGKSIAVNYGPWNHEIFNEEGRYRINAITGEDETARTFSQEFKITPPSFWRSVWNNVFYRPIFNTLFFMISIMPGNDLGWAVIALTLLIKIALIGPNQKALKAQKKMQKIQPQLEALKVKYKNDQQKLAQETMAIWKKHKVSPASSCLPMLIQFPILIALFYVVKDGMDVINPELFYDTLKGFDFQSINVVFLGLMDLTKKNFIILPILVGGMQFIQMKLTFAKSKNSPQPKNSPMPMMNNMMQYAMPIMIAVFTASLPAAVGFYWGTSTLFGIGQQVMVNKLQD